MIVPTKAVQNKENENHKNKEGYKVQPLSSLVLWVDTLHGVRTGFLISWGSLSRCVVISGRDGSKRTLAVFSHRIERGPSQGMKGKNTGIFPRALKLMWRGLLPGAVFRLGLELFLAAVALRVLLLSCPSPV